MTGNGDIASAEITRDEVEGVPVMRVSGELDLANVDEIGRRLLEPLAVESASIVVDLGKVRFMDSSGLRMLLEVNAQVGDGDGSLHLVPGKGSFVSHLLDVTQVGSVLAIHASVEDAVESARS